MGEIKGLTAFVARIYGKAFYRGFALVFLLAMITAAAQFALTYYLGVVIDSVDMGLRAVAHYFALIGAGAAIGIASNAAWGFLSGRMMNRVLLSLRSRLGSGLCGASYGALELYDEGHLLSVVTGDVEGLRPWLSSLFWLGHLPVKVVLSFILLCSISWQFTLFLLPLLPLATIPPLLLSQKLYALNMAERSAAGATTGFINEALDFLIVIKSFCMQQLFMAKNRRLLTGAQRARLNRMRKEQVIQTIGRCTGHITNPLILIAGAYLILSGLLTVGRIVTIILLCGVVGEALGVFCALPTNFQVAKACADRAARILALPQERQGSGAARLRAVHGSAFEIEGLRFSYAPREAIRGIDLSIAQGEKIAVVGMSGSGKTTLFKLLCGLYAPEAGTIRFFGTDLSALSVEALRRELSVVAQEPFLFPDTARGNISIARPDARDAQLIEACENARIHSFLASLENGYDTALGAGGKPLSKGQLQRINLARAFLRDAPVWLLDEPTSALDAEAHTAVMEYILGQEGRTIVAITHRLTTPERFDRVLVMDEGRIAAFAGHGELLHSSGLYRALLENMERTVRRGRPRGGSAS